MRAGLKNELGLLGNGGQADEVESYLEEGQRVVFRAVTQEYLGGSRAFAIDIEDNPYRGYPVIAAVGAPRLKKELIEKWGGTCFSSVIHRDAYIGNDLDIGKGSVIAPGATLTTNVRIGRHVIVNVNASISHDSSVGDYSTISPGVSIAGHVTIGSGVFIGIGAIVSNRIRVADGCVVSAGAVLVEDVPNENSVVAGVPARVIKSNTAWIREL